MTSTPNDQPAPHKRRWLRFSLKTALVLVSLYCVWLAFIAIQARRQQQALARVDELRGMVAFAFELDPEGLNWESNAKPFVPSWLRRAIGEDYFRRVAIVNFDEGSDPSDDDLAVLENFPDLRQLTISNRRQVSDAGLAHLAGLKHLKVLTLDGTNVAGPGLIHLQKLDELEGLTLSSTPVTNDGLKHLAALSNLQWLHLNDTKITDDGLRYLADLPALKSLQLVNTEITDAGLKQLESIAGLQQIMLRGTKTTPAGRAALQKALPNCQVP